MKAIASLTCTLALALCTTVLSPLAEAEDAPGRQVTYSDLNLARPEGIAALYRRIATAAQLVCEPINFRAPQNAARGRACAKESIARAISQIDMPALSLYHAKRTFVPERIQRVTAQ